MPEPDAQRKKVAPSSSPLLSIAGRTSLAVIAAGLIALGGAGLLGGGWGAAAWGWAPRSDKLAPSERQERQQAFDAIGSLRLIEVPAPDSAQAIAEMHLPEPQRQALAAALAPAVSSVAAASPATATPVTAAPVTAAPAVAPTPAPAAAPQGAVAASPRLRLVWVTLWDTDVEDGDVVRIDSEGYSRTVVLTKRGTTIAVPLPAAGAIRISGINDGDGGGITVGLASGAAKVVFPIMSVGQTLQLAATVR